MIPATQETEAGELLELGKEEVAVSQERVSQERKEGRKEGRKREGGKEGGVGKGRREK